MEIWEIQGDINRFASFKLEPEIDIEFDGSSKLATWVPPHGTFYKQKKYKKGDFANGALLLGTVACNEKALHCLYPLSLPKLRRSHFSWTVQGSPCSTL